MQAQIKTNTELSLPNDFVKMRQDFTSAVSALPGYSAGAVEVTIGSFTLSPEASARVALATLQGIDEETIIDQLERFLAGQVVGPPSPTPRRNRRIRERAEAAARKIIRRLRRTAITVAGT